MKTSKAGRTLCGALLAAGLVVLVAGQVSAQTEVAFAPTMSHVNQKLPDLMTLHANIIFSDFCDPGTQITLRARLHRTYPDGASLPFSIPPGKFLVVTDVAVELAPRGDPGQQVAVSLHLLNARTGLQFPVLLSSVILPSSGPAIANVQLTTGFTVGGAAEVCVRAFDALPTDLVLHGYLMRFP